jgi:hypothetical protein
VFSLTSPEKRKPLNLFWLSGLYGSCAWGRTKDLLARIPYSI